MAKDHKSGKSQVARFRAAAREFGADGNEKSFNEKPGEIAKATPAIPPKKSKKK
jgi:hypothetical protein